jgi:hypothetical protein
MVKTSWSVLFRKIIAVHSKNHNKLINVFCEKNVELLIIKAGGTYSYHWAFKDYGTDVVIVREVFRITLCSIDDRKVKCGEVR